MGISDLSKYSRLIVRLYVAMLIMGVMVGISTDFTFEVGSTADSAIYGLAWPLAGIMFGATWLGVGPLIALFAGGIYLGGLVKSYTVAGGTLIVGGGAVSSQLVTSTMDLARGSMEVLAFLYGAVAGMYLALHYAEIYDYGTSIDDTPTRNFKRKLIQSLAIAFIAVGLKAAGV
jgi:formate/nitrite transporter FocA (FNT family)